MSCVDVVDPKVEVNLLWVPMGPIGWDVVGRKLDSDAGLTVDEHHVPPFLCVNGATEESGPEGALGGQVSGVEYNDLMLELHSVHPRCSRVPQDDLGMT